jgi:hypothetical protein
MDPTSTLHYAAREERNRYRGIKLSVGRVDGANEAGVGEARRRRLVQVLKEAASQGVRLGYRDLMLILLASRATLKRDVRLLRKRGIDVSLRYPAGRTATR